MACDSRATLSASSRASTSAQRFAIVASRATSVGV
jgi:hypothetical protein